MVNVTKHRALLNDTETRLRKRIIKQQLLSKNSQKTERLGNRLLINEGGKVGKNSIVETNLKRDKANKTFRSILNELEG